MVPGDHGTSRSVWSPKHDFESQMGDMMSQTQTISEPILALPARRRRFLAISPVRARRLRAGLTLADVAVAAGLTHNRLSVLERDPEVAIPGELQVVRRSIDRLAEARR